MGAAKQECPGDLPLELTSFVGRKREVAEGKALLSRARAVTLVGPGGVGKTRLALRMAAEMRRAFPDGVRFVDLAQLREGDLLPFLVGEALEVQEQSGGDVTKALCRSLRGRQLLLILDNCEHVVDACAQLVNSVLRADPGVRVLATSRQRLGVTGEHVQPVSTLPVPAVNDEGPSRFAPTALAEFSAVALFAERAAAVTDFSLTEENWPTVVRLCRRLEGLPLAIELAAVRTRTMSAAEILRRLDDQFGLLESIDQATPSRHRTLLATVSDSYELCSPEERLLWARATIFAGPFELEAAEGICSDGRLPTGKVLDAVAGLVDKSVLTREELAGSVRFRLPDSLAQYGRQRLHEAGEEGEMTRRHRDWYLELVERMEGEWYGPKQLDWSRRMHRDHANLQVALANCLTAPTEGQAALRMTAAMVPWNMSGIFTEARLWLDRALALDSRPTPARARALRAHGIICAIQGDTATGHAALEECRDLARQVGDPFLEGFARGNLALAATREDPEEAGALAEEALTYPEYAQDPQACDAWLALVMVRSMRGEYEGAIAASEAILRRSAACGEISYRSWALVARAVADFGKGDQATAAAHAREAMEIKRQFGDTVGIGQAVMVLAWTALGSGDLERGCVLLGAHTRLRKSYDLSGGFLPWDAQTDQLAVRAQQGLGEDAFQRAIARGLEFDLEQTVGYALGLGEGPVTAKGGAVPSPLTRREEQVAELVAQGMSNKQIAHHLVVSQRTAEAHVEHILIKLGFTSRAQIASWYTRREPA
ncbi:LuxR C-terminal-related transcriptional regulator [Streptomyces sp. NPDC047108]|uniref:ATP-binding protein n=1 Tax=Streptomyces sp. NPDC047108 TaxID=3155025 RepID=UPI0033D74A1C